MLSKAVCGNLPNADEFTDMLLDGLSKLFAEIKEKEKIEDLSVEYKKFAEWLRIEYSTPYLSGRAR